MTLHNECPAAEELSHLLAGELAPADEQKMQAHLDMCNSCQQTMLALSGSSAAMIDRLHGLDRREARSSDSLQRALRELEQEVGDCENLDNLPFLQPATEPHGLRTIGVYQVQGIVGSGGMGIVLKARDPSLNRLTAIKVLRPEIAANGVSRQRFLREARAAAAIGHDHLVTIFAVDEVQGYPFLVMEFIDGMTLQTRLREQGPFAPAEVVRIGMQIAGGLAAAHAQGVIHRDIKPDNILLCGPDDRAKITDFGLAHVVDDVQLTRTGVVAGTPPYMSPEQAEGARVDTRSDLFSLGCVLYAMCVGASPFQGQSTIDTIRRVCDATPRPLGEVNSHIPSVLIAVIDRLLEKKAVDRYQTAAEVVTALESCRAACTGSENERVSRAVAPPRTPALDDTKTLDSWESWQHRVAAGIETPSIAVLPFANLSGDPENEYFGDGLAEDLIASLTQYERLFVVARSSAFQFKGQNLDVREVGRKLNVRAVLEGSVRKAGDRIRISAQLIDVATGYHLWSQRYDRELKDIFDVQDDIARTIVDELKLKFGPAIEQQVVKHQTDDADAYSRYLRGRFYWNKREPASLRRAIDYFDQALGRDPDYAAALAGKADCQVLLADYSLVDQHEALTSAKQCASRALELDDALAEAHKAMGFVLACLDRDWIGAGRHFQRALDIAPDAADIRLAYALGVLLPLGRFDESLQHAQRAVEFDPVTPMVVSAPGVVLTYSGRLDEARAVFEDALEVDPTHPVVNLWSCPLWIALHDFDRAATAISHARPFELMAEEFAAIVAVLTGRTEDVNAAREKFLSDVSHGRPGAALSLGRLFTALGETDAALDWLERAVNERIAATVFLGVDPTYARLRGDSRFESLLRKLQIPRSAW